MFTLAIVIILAVFVLAIVFALATKPAKSSHASGLVPEWQRVQNNKRDAQYAAEREAAEYMRRK